MEAGTGCYCEVGGVGMKEWDIRAMSTFLMMPSVVIPTLLMAAYNFHMAKIVQHHPLAQEMLTFTVLIIGAVTVVGLIGFLMFVFSKEVVSKFEEWDK
jgi:hypothetical protein